jgi:hypothetical protein
MSQSLYCSTPFAQLLLALGGSDLPLRFPFASHELPGVSLEVKPRESIYLQLLAAVQRQVVGIGNGFSLDIVTGFSAPIVGAPQETTLYLARSNDPLLLAYFASAAHCLTMPELLRRMPKDKKRVAYLLAWQTLLGVGEEKLYALSRKDVLDLLK